MQVAWQSVLDLRDVYERAIHLTALVNMARIVRHIVKALHPTEFRFKFLRPVDRGSGVFITFLSNR